MSERRISFDPKFPPLEDGDGKEVLPEAFITVKSHPQPFSDEKHGPNKPYRWSGLLIKSGVGIHDKTLLGFENEPHAQSLFGEVVCPYIDELVRNYDSLSGSGALPEWNNVRVLDPERDGLIREHPYVEALYGACESVIRKIVEERKRAESAKESVIRNRSVDSWLRSAMRKVSRLFEEKLKEIDEVLPPTRLEGPQRAWPIGLTIIPPGEHDISIGDTKWFSVVVNFGSAMKPGAAVSLRSDQPQGIRLSCSAANLEPDPSDVCVGRCTFAVTGESVGAEGFVSVSSNGWQDVILIAVVSVQPPPLDEIPEGLSFDKSDYRVGYGKGKDLPLRFRGTVSDGSMVAKVSSNNPGLVVKTQVCTLRPAGDGQTHQGLVSVIGRRVGAAATVTAILAATEERAEAKVTVTESGPGGGSLLKPPKPVDRDFGSVRAKWSDADPGLLEIACRHPAISPYLGPASEDFPGQQREGYRAVLAETIAEALSWRILERRYERQEAREGVTAEQYYTEYGELMRSFLGALHQGVAEGEGFAASPSEAADPRPKTSRRMRNADDQETLPLV